MRKSIALSLLVAALSVLTSSGTNAQEKLYQRYVASDTDLYGGHPDRGGALIRDAAGNPVFADAGTMVETADFCSDEWCALTDGTYLWGGDLCAFTRRPAPCTEQ